MNCHCLMVRYACKVSYIHACSDARHHEFPFSYNFFVGCRWSMRRLTVSEAAVVGVAVAAVEEWRGVMVVWGSGGQLCRALQSLELETYIYGALLDQIDSPLSSESQRSLAFCHSPTNKNKLPHILSLFPTRFSFSFFFLGLVHVISFYLA